MRSRVVRGEKENKVRKERGMEVMKDYMQREKKEGGCKNGWVMRDREEAERNEE